MWTVLEESGPQRLGSLRAGICNRETESMSHSRHNSLTLREREVLNLVATGLSNQHITQRLNIKYDTVKFHLRKGYLKLGVKNRLQAALIMERRGTSNLMCPNCGHKLTRW
jgi:ATP/maltotriose-dependent transcriptional regulator MalT